MSNRSSSLFHGLTKGSNFSENTDKGSLHNQNTLLKGRGKVESVFVIAKKITELNEKIPRRETLTSLRLHKILYYAQGWYLTRSIGEPLFQETIEAWRYGPVVPDLYYELKKNSVVKIIDLQKIDRSQRIQKSDTSELDDVTTEYLDTISNIYKDKPTSELVSQTHNHEVWLDHYNAPDPVMSVEDIRKEFLMIAAAHD